MQFYFNLCFDIERSSFSRWKFVILSDSVPELTFSSPRLEFKDRHSVWDQSIVLRPQKRVALKKVRSPGKNLRTLQPTLQKNFQEQNLNFLAELETHSEEWVRCLKSNEHPPTWVGWWVCLIVTKIPEFPNLIRFLTVTHWTHWIMKEEDQEIILWRSIACPLGICMLIKMIMKHTNVSTSPCF